VSGELIEEEKGKLSEEMVEKGKIEKFEKIEKEKLKKK